MVKCCLYLLSAETCSFTMILVPETVLMSDDVSPMERITTDIMGPLDRTTSGNKCPGGNRYIH